MVSQLTQLLCALSSFQNCRDITEEQVFYGIPLLAFAQHTIPLYSARDQIENVAHDLGGILLSSALLDYTDLGL
jgi:hypothetical protein